MSLPSSLGSFVPYAPALVAFLLGLWFMVRGVRRASERDALARQLDLVRGSVDGLRDLLQTAESDLAQEKKLRAVAEENVKYLSDGRGGAELKRAQSIADGNAAEAIQLFDRLTKLVDFSRELIERVAYYESELVEAQAAAEVETARADGAEESLAAQRQATDYWSARWAERDRRCNEAAGGVLEALAEVDRSRAASKA